eukprot:845593-Rhodomonas_salina.1
MDKRAVPAQWLTLANMVRWRARPDALSRPKPEVGVPTLSHTLAFYPPWPSLSAAWFSQDHTALRGNSP